MNKSYTPRDIDTDSLEWIDYQDFQKATNEQVEELTKTYRFYLEGQRIYLVPRTKR